MIFEVGDEMIVHLKKDKFHFGTYNKLKMKKFGPCIILRKFNHSNAYEFEFLNDMDISPIFNVVDLYKYHASNDEMIVLIDYLKK